MAFSALAGAIVLLYILKLRRTRVTIGSTLLWEKAVHDFKANAPWQKLRRNLLMILQIIALVLLAIALARPFVFGTATLGGRTVVVIDTSSSMLATDEHRDRLETAIDGARQLVTDLSRNDEAMIIAAGPAPLIHASFTKDKNELLDALGKVRDSAGGISDINSALQLISSVSAGTSTRVVIFSDGCLPDLDPFATTDLLISFYPVGISSNNIGIVNARARRNPFSEDYEIFVAIHNYYGGPKTVDVTLSIGDNLFDVREVELNAGQRRELVLSNMPYQPLPITLELDLEDELAEDNVAYIMMPERRSYKVALCSNSESYLLRKLLDNMEEIELYSFEGEESIETYGQADVWIVEDDAECGIDPTAAYLFIDSTQATFLPVVPGTKAVEDFTADPPVIPTIIGSNRSHPIMRFVNISDLNIESMRRVQLHNWAQTVVEASVGPLIVEGNYDGQRIIYFAFNLYETNLPLKPAFPILMANTIQYLGEAASGSESQANQSGERVPLLAPIEAERVEITPPQGDSYTMELGTREFTLSDTHMAGVYTLEYLFSDQVVKRQYVPVSLTSDDESNIFPSQTLRVMGVEEVLNSGIQPQEISGSKEVRTNREFYTWLILAVVLLISVEWWLYHRRAL